MPLPRVIPALADLTQEIAGPLPLDLLRTWAEGRGDASTARELLSAFKIRGIVAASDTAGLSRLSEEKDLLDLLALISRPKGILHGLGVAIGGRAIGTWVADNTLMHYPDTVAPEAVLAAMTEAQCRIAERGHLAVGMCVHGGAFYEIGGGLYGREANTVEWLAEHHAAGGEILVTSAVADDVADVRGFQFRPRPELRGYDGSRVFALHAERRMRELPETAMTYPHPYTPEFFEAVCAVADGADLARTRAEVYARHLQRRAVLFVSAIPETGDDTLADLLDGLVINALIDTIVRHTVGSATNIAGSGNGLAILTFDTAADAVECAMTIRARLLENAITAKAGIDEGPVLLFSSAAGPSGITGEPVNIASKISEDAGVDGQIYITSRAAARVARMPPSQPFETTVSGVRLSGLFF